MGPNLSPLRFVLCTWANGDRNPWTLKDAVVNQATGPHLWERPQHATVLCGTILWLSSRVHNWT